MLEVLLVEELRVVETGTHDALVAVDDGGGAFGVAVGDDDELVRQLARSIVEREVALMHEHGVDDDLPRAPAKTPRRRWRRAAAGTRRG